MNIPSSDNYFVDGGTLRASTPSYVARPADDELFRALLAREFCYVLTPRQMGKSSLMIRTQLRLKEYDIKSATVDIQRIGTDQIKAWYGSMLTQICRQLKLSIDVDEWMKQKSNLGFGELFVHFIQDVVLAEITEPVVIFLDEVDWMIKIKFRDDFFASIRAIYNARAQYPELERVSFVLLGVASPADLIAEPTRTPFNIGHAIHLQELSLDDAQPLLTGLEVVYQHGGKRILDRIFYWTNGHPYLTQKLCKSIVERGADDYSDEMIDRLVYDLFLSDKSRNEANIKLVQERILTVPEKFELLEAYKRVLRSRQREDRQSSLHKQLMLSGVVIVKDGYLVVRNRIYLAAFNKKWVDENLRRDWRRIAIVILGILLTSIILTAAVITSQNNGKRGSINVYILDFNEAYDNKSYNEQVTSLANIFRTNGILTDLNEDETARELFFNKLKDEEEQKALFINSSDNPELQEDLAVIVRGVYYSLVMITPDNDNTELLETMRDVLDDKSDLYSEMVNWVEARHQVMDAHKLSIISETDDEEIASHYVEARKYYDAAIAINSSNPALYYERALVYLNLKDKDILSSTFNALNDLDRLVSLAGPAPSRNLETPTQSQLVSTETITATSGPDTLPTFTAKASVTVTETQLTGKTRTPSPTPNPTTKTQIALNPAVTRPPTFTPIPPTPTFTPRPIETSTPTPSPTPKKFRPGFYKSNVPYYDIRAEVERVFKEHPWLSDTLVANRDTFPNLRDAELVKFYPTFTPTATPTYTSTPEPKGLLFLSGLPTISRGDAGNIGVVGQLGKGIVQQAIYSPNGETLAVASSRGIYLYDAVSLEQEQDGFIETTNSINRLAFSPDGTILASALDDSSIRFWDVASREPIGNVLIGHSGIITALVFSPDGNTIASGSEDATVRLWRISDGRLLPSSEDQSQISEAVRSVAFSPDGQFLAYATDENNVYVWNMSDGSLQWTFPGNSIAFLPDGQKLVVCSEASVSIRSMVNGNLLYQDYFESGREVTISADGQMIAMISTDDDIRLLQVADNKFVSPQTLGTNMGMITSIAFSPNGQMLASTSTDNIISFWRPGTGDLIQILEDHVSNPYLALSFDEKLLASGSPEGRINLWSLEDGEILRSFWEQSGYVRSLSFSPDGRRLVSGADDGSVRLWDVDSGILLQTLDGHSDVVWSVVFSPDGQYILSGSDDGTAHRWYLPQLDDEGKQQEFAYNIPVHGVAYSNDGDSLAFGLGNPYNNNISVLSTRFNLNTRLSGHRGDVRSVCFSPDGRFIASGSSDTTIRLWNISSNFINTTETLVGHTATVTSVVFSPDGTLLVSGSNDGTVRLWDVETGRLLQTLADHRDSVLSVVFSSDGKFIVSGSLDGTIKIWGVP